MLCGPQHLVHYKCLWHSVSYPCSYVVWSFLGQSMLLQVASFHSFYGWVVFHCMYVCMHGPHLYPFICQWTFRLFPCLVVQSLNHIWLFSTPWTAACQASLSFTISQSLLKFMSVMPSNHLILWHPFFLLPFFHQHQGLLQRVSFSHQVAKVLQLQLQQQSFQWIFKVDYL